MKVSLTQFARLALDANGKMLPCGSERLGCQVLTAVGAFAAVSNDCRFIRIATDTAIQMDIAGGATDATDELIPANTVEFFGGFPKGATFTIA